MGIVCEQALKARLEIRFRNGGRPLQSMSSRAFSARPLLNRLLGFRFALTCLALKARYRIALGGRKRSISAESATQRRTDMKDPRSMV
jgi:hypothetical protein